MSVEIKKKGVQREMKARIGIDRTRVKRNDTQRSGVRAFVGSNGVKVWVEGGFCVRSGQK